MSYADGWAALNLEMPPRVPRTEYSIEHYHTPILRHVTGIPLEENSPAELRHQASLIFRKRWNYDFCWSVLINNQPFGDLHTRMGHASFAENSADLDRHISCPFEDPEDVLSFDPMEAFGPVNIASARDDFSKHYANTRSELPDEVATTGIYTTLVSGLIELFGWDMLLLSAGVDQQGFGEVANRYDVGLQSFPGHDPAFLPAEPHSLGTSYPLWIHTFSTGFPARNHWSTSHAMVYPICLRINHYTAKSMAAESRPNHFPGQ